MDVMDLGASLLGAALDKGTVKAVEKGVEKGTKKAVEKALKDASREWNDDQVGVGEGKPWNGIFPRMQNVKRTCFGGSCIVPGGSRGYAVELPDDEEIQPVLLCFAFLHFPICPTGMALRDSKHFARPEFKGCLDAYSERYLMVVPAEAVPHFPTRHLWILALLRSPWWIMPLFWRFMSDVSDDPKSSKMADLSFYALGSCQTAILAAVFVFANLCCPSPSEEWKLAICRSASDATAAKLEAAQVAAQRKRTETITALEVLTADNEEAMPARERHAIVHTVGASAACDTAELLATWLGQHLHIDSIPPASALKTVVSHCCTRTYVQ
eukprot:COSAG05_NODE_3419_length_2078_cov_1.148560_1_plen_326_part_00